MAVARHLHLGRAAAELHTAQPVLSRQIRALENELHASLFRRDRRSTDVVWARITDIPANQVSVAWESTRRDPLMAEFAALAERFPAA